MRSNPCWACIFVLIVSNGWPTQTLVVPYKMPTATNIQTQTEHHLQKQSTQREHISRSQSTNLSPVGPVQMCRLNQAWRQVVTSIFCRADSFCGVATCEQGLQQPLKRSRLPLSSQDKIGKARKTCYLARNFFQLSQFCLTALLCRHSRYTTAHIPLLNIGCVLQASSFLTSLPWVSRGWRLSKTSLPDR